MKRPHLVIDVITLFPKLLEAPLNESMARQAKLRGAVQIRIWNLRDYALDKRRTCDDKPFGGGAGMVMMIQPIDDCLKDIPLRNDAFQFAVFIDDRYVGKFVYQH